MPSTLFRSTFCFENYILIQKEKTLHRFVHAFSKNKRSSTTSFLTRSTQERTLSTTSILGWFNFKLLHAWGFMSSVHLFIVKYILIVLMGDAYLWLFSGNNSITNWVIWVVLLKIDDLSFDLSFSALYCSKLSKWAI